jgi:hypothetical protein
MFQPNSPLGKLSTSLGEEDTTWRSESMTGFFDASPIS